MRWTWEDVWPKLARTQSLEIESTMLRFTISHANSLPLSDLVQIRLFWHFALAIHNLHVLPRLRFLLN